MASLRYVERVRALLDEVFDQEGAAIAAAIDLITAANLEKRSVFIFGASHAGILSEEMYYRAGGLITINPIFGRELMLDRNPVSFTSQMERLPGYGTLLGQDTPFQSGDVLILHSVSGRNTVTIDLALYAKSLGVHIIALTNVSYSASTESRHPSGKRLFEIADVVIDNHGDIGDASVQIPGVPQAVGATSTVIGATILNAIIVEVVANLVAAGVENPPIFYSANLDGGDALNKQIVAQYRDVIHYDF